MNNKQAICRQLFAQKNVINDYLLHSVISPYFLVNIYHDILEQIKKLLIVFLSILSLVHSLQVHPSFAVNKGRWAMFIPENDAKLELLNCECQKSYLEYLKELGKRAHINWQIGATPIELAEQFHNLFSSVDASFLIKVIDDILSSENHLLDVTKASYRNVTGFLKIVLVGSDKESWRLRLHIWDQDGIEDLHNHKWDYFSKVIIGSLYQDTYEVMIDETNLNNDMKKYSVREPVSLMPLDENGAKPCPCRDSYSLNYKLVDNGENYFVYLNKTSSSLIQSGFSYFMPHELIHRINPSKNSVTFVFTSEQVQKNSEVFLLNSVNDDAYVQRYAPSVTQEEVRIALLDVRNKLKANINESR